MRCEAERTAHCLHWFRKEMFLFLSRLHIDTAERCGIFGVLFYTILFHFILFCWNKEMETLFTHFFFFSLGLHRAFLLLASVFYPENLILQTNNLTLSLFSGDEINCFLIPTPPPPPFLVAAPSATYSWTSVGRPRLRAGGGGSSCIYRLIIFISLEGGGGREIYKTIKTL